MRWVENTCERPEHRIHTAVQAGTGRIFRISLRPVSFRCRKLHQIHALIQADPEDPTRRRLPVAVDQ